MLDLPSPLVAAGFHPAAVTALREIVVIDTGLADWAVLRDGVEPGVELVLIDAGGDGLGQLVRALQGRHGIDVLHIMSHGFPGGFWLGTARLDAAALVSRRGDWACLAAGLSADARIALHGCETARGGGPAFLSGLATATGAAISASISLTGAARLGGDWELAYCPEGAAPRLPLSEAARQGYAHVMIPSLTYSSAAGYVGEQFYEMTFSRALDAAAPPLASAFSVQINGTGAPVTTVTVSGSSVRLGFAANPLTAGDIIEFSYADPTEDDDPDAVQDADGIDAETFSTSTVVMGARPANEPSLTATGGTPTFIQASGIAVDLFSDVTASANDAGQTITGFTLTVTNVSDVNEFIGGGGFQTGIVLVNGAVGMFGQPGAGGGGASVSMAGSTATVTVTGLSYDASAFANAMDGLLYFNSAATVVPGPRVVTLTSVSDSGGSNNVGVPAASVATVNVTAVDTTPPAVPVITSPALTNDITPAIAGTAEAGSTVTVTVGGATYTTVATGGAWSIDLGTAAPVSGTLELNLAGANAVSVTATDAAANVSTAASQSLSFDTTAPDAPSITSPALTNDTTPAIAGTAEAGSTVTVSVAGATYTTVAVGGAWSVDLGTATPVSGALKLNQNGKNPVTATATDAASNVSQPAGGNFTIDSTAPVAPAVTSPAATNSPAPVLTGTAEAGSTVSVSIAGATYTTLATGGTWSVDLGSAMPASGTLALDLNGKNPVTVTATDAASNVSLPTEQSVFIDTNVPATPVITSPALTRDGTPAIAGTAEAGSTVTVVVAGATYTTVASDGTWSIDLGTATPVSGALALDVNGVNAVSATVADAGGNLSAPALQSLGIDTTVPAAPAITSPALTNDATPAISGTAEAGSIVTVTVAGATYRLVATGGVWSLDLGSATPTAGLLELNLNGPNEVAATAADAAGNASVPAGQVLTLDTTVPAVPAAPALAPASDSGVAGDGITNATTPVLTGVGGEPGTVVTLIDTVGGGAVVLGQATVDEAGRWSFVPPATLAAGLHSISVTATDAAGNVSAASAPLALTLYPTGPGVPTLVSEAPRSGPQQPVLSGTSAPVATVMLFSGDAAVGSAPADADGRWSFSFPAALAAGAYTLTARAGDAAGNLSAASAPLTLNVAADGSYTVGQPDATGNSVAQVYDAAGTLTAITQSDPTGRLLQTVTASSAVRNIYNDQGVLIGTIAQPVGGITEQPEFETTGLPSSAVSFSSDRGSVITFTAQVNVITTQGNDRVFANGDTATIFALGPNTTVMAGYGTLTFIGGQGASTVMAGTGRTVAFGGAGGGTLQGGSAGQNVLVSGGGATTLVGGGSGDLLVGGAGDTTIVMRAGGLAFGGVGSTTMFAAENATLVGGSGSNVMVANAGPVTMWGGSGSNQFWGGSGNAVFGAGAGETTMVGGSGNNSFVGGTGHSTARGGTGNETFFTGPGRMDIVEGGGSDKVVFGSGSASVASGAGRTEYIFVAGSGGGNDLISGFTVGADRLALFGYDLGRVQTTTAGGNTTLSLVDGTRISLLGVSVTDVTALF